MSDERAPLLPRTHVIAIETSPAASMSALTFWRVGAFLGATAVALGAFGSHGLKQRINDPQKIANWGTAAQYQLIHSVVILVARGNPIASTLLTLGVAMFSGSIYALVLDRDTFKSLGPVTPIGGSLMIAGWVVLLFSKGPGRSLVL